MPSVSKVQQEAASIELARRRAGKGPRRFASMKLSDLKVFASTPRKGLPHRAASGTKKRRQRLAEVRAGGK